MTIKVSRLSRLLLSDRFIIFTNTSGIAEMASKTNLLLMSLIPLALLSFS